MIKVVGRKKREEEDYKKKKRIGRCCWPVSKEGLLFRSIATATLSRTFEIHVSGRVILEFRVSPSPRCDFLFGYEGKQSVWQKNIPGPRLSSRTDRRKHKTPFSWPLKFSALLFVFSPNALGRKGHKKSNPVDFVGICFFVGEEEVGRVKNLGAFVSSVFLFLFQIRITCFPWIVATKTHKKLFCITMSRKDSKHAAVSQIKSACKS